VDVMKGVAHDRCRICAASWWSSSYIRIVRNNMGGKNKKFLSFISKKRE
jgi:hypothetical protein